MEQWCDSCGKMTKWINGECENYQPIKTSNSTSMETSPSKAPLTWEQAKLRTGERHGCAFVELRNGYKEAAELYATSRVQALEESIKKKDCELLYLRNWRSDAEAQFVNLKEQNKRLEGRIDIADKLLLEARQRWSRGDHFEYCDMWQMGYDEYNSLNQNV